MRGRALRKLKQNSAFTMMEMLVTVAVMTVLLGISMLGISELMTSLKMTELDRYAKTIYLEAQNQLTAKEVEGGLENYHQIFLDDYSERFLQTMPHDFDEDSYGEAWKQLCHVSKQDEIAKTLIPATSNMYQNGGNYIIELNPETGDVYGVFYWDEETALSYADIIGLVDRSLEERTHKSIGYYGGSVSDTMSSGVVLDQQVQLVNGEELYLKVSYDASARLRRYYSNSLQIAYEISNETGTVAWSGYMDLDTMTDMGDRLEFTLVLDSMNPGEEFVTITAGSGLKPGENLSIVITSTYEHGSDYCMESNALAPVTGNSLYGNSTDEDTIEVSNLRHFRNLDETYVDSSLYAREDGESLTVLIADDIDFAANTYITSIAPISNTVILDNSTVTALVNGEAYTLKNFVISAAEDNAGLFESAQNVVFQNITIQDITIKATTANQNGVANVGALVGSLTGGRIDACGVYLTTAENYESMQIAARENAGGLVGLCTDAVISNSFAAIRVVASGNQAGGLAGAISGTTVENCYASGYVTAQSASGGLIGKATDSTITGAYSTGNVYGNDQFGGFLGSASGCTLSDCVSYGEVLKIDMALLDGAAAGGFIYAGNSTGNTYTSCRFLTQNGYNKQDLSDPAEIGTNTYKGFVAEASGNTLSVGASYPYDETLLQQAFPFAKLAGQTAHYGDWPAQYVIDTSLVYYEKYADGSYGYYGVTYIMDDSHVWLLNTLRDETCVEDGYALLSKYNISELKYDLYVGSADTADKSDVSLEIVNAESLITGTEGAGKAVRLIQQGNIEFNAYTSYDTVTGTITGETGESFLVNGMYLYQLPYDLQCTDRYGIENFYDRFVIKDVKAKGSSMTVIAEMTFFYCPHFAKTAVNPNVNSGETSPTSIWNPQYVSVRSARQLNALGRYPYYWNANGGNNTEMYFVQESDINFSTYTNGTKLYCGYDFDLTAFDKDYANKPIGQTYRADLVDKYGSDYSFADFSNNYNGNSYEIIDYCVKSDLMFVGLFGEIEDATIENVIMTVSPEVANDSYTGDAGKIISNFVSVGDASGHASVGAMIGMAYMEDNIIRNCATAGYEVEMQLDDAHVGRLAIGGLVGISMSSISNCSAVNDIRIVLLSDESGNNASLFMGGLSGSFLYGTLENCYAGGTMDIVDGNNNNNYLLGHLTLGGVTAGGLYVPNEYSGYNNKLNAAEETAWSNCYTYTRILNPYRNSGGTVCNKLFTAYTRYYRDPNGIGFLGSYSEAAIGENGVNCYYLDSAYEGYDITTRDSVYRQGYKRQCNLDLSTSLDYAGLSALNAGNLTNRVSSKDTTYPTSSELSNARYPFPAVVQNVRTGEYVHYGDWPAQEQRMAASYPVYFEQYDTGDYGVYYVKEDGTAVSTLVGDDSKEILATGYGYMTLDESQSGAAVFNYTMATEYGGIDYYVIPCDYEDLYAMAGTTSAISGSARAIAFSYAYETVVVSGGEVLGTESTVSKTLYINPNFAAALSLSEGTLGTATQPLQVRTPAQLGRVSKIIGSDIYMAQTHSIDLSAGHTPVTVSYSHCYDGGATKGFAIKNATDTIFASNQGTITDVCVVSSDINSQNNTAIFVVENTGTITDSSVRDSQLTTVGNAAGFVYTNSGTIQNASLVATTAYTDSQVRGYKAFGFVADNSGSIRKSFVAGTVTGQAEAAGFASNNTGVIQTSYANARVSATAGLAGAAGFVLKTSDVTDGLKYCYAAGVVEAYHAYGFVCKGSTSWCYTVSQISGADMYGFAGTDAQTDACYWGYDEAADFNMTLYRKPKGEGQPIALARLMRGDAGGDYDTDVDPDVPYTQWMGTEYPYPSVGLVHIGDWQPPSVEKQNTTINTTVLNNQHKEAGIFYYERYMDGTYGVYLVGTNRNDQSNPRVLVNTLAAADEPVLTSGYGVFYQENGWEIDIMGDWLGAYAVTDFEDNVLDGFAIEGVETAYKFRYITESEAQDYVVCTMTYNNLEKTMTISADNFNRPE